MKAYTDIFKKRLTKDDVRQATIATVRNGTAVPTMISRQLKIGFAKANQLSKIMYDAGVVVDSTLRGTTVILKNEAQAINAALRQLKKGKGEN